MFFLFLYVAHNFFFDVDDKKEIGRDIFFEGCLSIKKRADFKKEKNFCQKGVILPALFAHYISCSQLCGCVNYVEQCYGKTEEKQIMH